MSENGSEKDVVVVGVPTATKDVAKKTKKNSNEATKELVKAVDAARSSLQERVDAATLALDEREAKLEEREVALKKAIDGVELEKQLMAGRTPGDVLKLNVGGTIIMIRRSTLCQYEDSLLAAHFSGRFDDSVEKMGEVFFIDEAPELFLGLVNFLRAKARETPSEPAKLPRALKDSSDFRSLWNFYGMPSLVLKNTFTWKWQNYQHVNQWFASNNFSIGGHAWKIEVNTCARSDSYEDYMNLRITAIGKKRTATIALTLLGTGTNSNLTFTSHKTSLEENESSTFYGDASLLRTNLIKSKFMSNNTLTIKAEIEVHSSG